MQAEAGKRGISKKWKAGLGVAVVAIAAAAVAAAVFFQSKPMLEEEIAPRVVSISAEIGRDGEIFSSDIPESGISDELNDALISLFLNAEMRNSLLPRPQNYTISDGSVYLSVNVSLERADALSMRVNLSNSSDYNSAQFGDTHYAIADHQTLYQDVYDLLSDVLPAYEVKR